MTGLSVGNLATGALQRKDGGNILRCIPARPQVDGQTHRASSSLGKNPNCVNNHPSNLMLNPVPHFMAFAWMMPMVSGFVPWNEKSDIWLQVLQQLQIKEICCFDGRALAPQKALGSC